MKSEKLLSLKIHLIPFLLDVLEYGGHALERSLGHDEHISDAHVEHAVHFVVIDLALALDELEDRGNFPGSAVDFGVAPEESITFDIVAVDPQWRGYGLQQRFIDWSMEVANASGAKYIHATVNPDNNHSGQNFLKRGFAVKKTGTKYRRSKVFQARSRKIGR